MPKQSEKDVLKELILMLGVSSLYCPQLVKGLCLPPNDTLLFLAILQFCRYVDTRTPVPKSVSPMDSFLSNTEFGRKHFRSHMRMHRAAFMELLELIKGHAVFRGSQEPIALQLAVTLYRLGAVGNISSKGSVAVKFGLSIGSVHNYAERVLCAINSLAATFIKWPEAEERAAIGEQMAKASLPKCIGFIDASEAILIAAPTEDKEDYWSSKMRFSIQFQIICDPSRMIRSFYTGYPGGTPDSTVYRNSEPFLQAKKYFSHGEYIIGDPAFPGSNNLVVPYTNHEELSDIQQTFNKHIIGKWTRVEETVGMLKGRFRSLTGIRIAVDGFIGHKRVCEWIQACAVLHNFLMHRDPWVRENDEVDTETLYDNDVESDEEAIQEGGDLRRDALCKLFKTECMQDCT